jgi:CRISPR-associated endonuclease Csn1
MWRTRQAHKAREHWLDEVMRKAGIEPLKGRQIGKVDESGTPIPQAEWNKRKGKWAVIAKGDPRLEREFAETGDPTCYTSCLLRIKLLRGEKFKPWQVYKALRSAIQRRGYDPDIPWKTREQRRKQSSDKEDDEAGTQERMVEFEKKLAALSKGNPELHYPCYFDAYEMGLWDGDSQFKERIDCQAKSTRDQIVPRKLVEKEVSDLVAAAAKQYPKLAGQAKCLLYGPTETPYASFDAKLRKKHGLREGGANDWQGVVGQKIPRFDNRIIGKCVLIPRLNVCKIRKGEDGELHPQSRIAAEVVFLMKLKNMRFQKLGGVHGLSAKEIGEIFNDPKRKKLALTPTQWRKWCSHFGGHPLPGLFAEVEEPKFSGRSRFCRPALEILKRLILSGDAPPVAYAKELARLDVNTDPLKGLVESDLKFLRQMGDTWDGIYIPNQKLEALAQSTDDAHEAIRRLIGSQNDPIVRHRLTLFADRLDELAEKHGTPDYVVLEFVREDFMGDKAKFEYLKFQRDRAKQRAEAREEAAKAGATEGAAGLKMELLKAQGGICLYTGEALIPTALDEYVIDHIVPRAKGGPDAVVNYALTTRRANDDKLDRTPYEWLSTTPGWDAYVARVRKCTVTLRNKKVSLLTSPDAETLVDKYTALAETAWISKLAQTIIGLRFGWPSGIDKTNRERKVIVVSGGLTGRIRRKYKLNSLLNPDAKSEEEAETKNRGDDRHHALDAMVISFLPNWARNARATGFFRFPDGVHRELFANEISEVVPTNVALEKPSLEETIYGVRKLNGEEYAVGRQAFHEFATKLVGGKRVLKKLADIETHRIVDGRIRLDVENFLERNSHLTLEEWDAWCATYRLGGDGPQVKQVLTTRSKADSLEEYKDVSKDGTGQLKRGAKHRGYFVYERPTATSKQPDRKQIEVRPVYVHESKNDVQAKLSQIHGYFESGCLVRLLKPWIFQGKEYPAGEYILTSIWANRNAKLRHPVFGEIGPVGLRILLDAGFQRVD